MCFLGEPLQYTVQSDAVTISPSGLGITIKIPPDAVPPEENANIIIRPCLSGPFHYPDGYEPLSAIYYITSDRHSKKNVELELVHFGELKTEEQARDMAFFSAESSPVNVGGKQQFKFNRMQGGEFTISKIYGTISCKHFCFLGIFGKPQGTCIYAVSPTAWGL